MGGRGRFSIGVRSWISRLRSAFSLKSAMHHCRVLLGLGLLTVRWVAALEVSTDPPPVVLETERVRYTIAPDGRNLGFTDRSTGIDYLRAGDGGCCAWLTRAGNEHPASSVSLADGLMKLAFGEAGFEVWMRLEVRPHFIRLAVERTEGAPVESLTFLNVPLSLRGFPEEAFGACAYSLNLRTRVDQLPALQSELRATAYSRFGLEGAEVAIVAVPTADMLVTLQELLTVADESITGRIYSTSGLSRSARWKIGLRCAASWGLRKSIIMVEGTFSVLGISN